MRRNVSNALKGLAYDAAAWLAIIGFLLIASCEARADYLGGLWPPGVNPPGAPASAVRVAPEGAFRGAVATASYTLTVVPKRPAYWEWAAVDAIDSAADEGEHVAHYSKAQRTGAGHIFGTVVEVSDYTGRGNAWGLEVDLMTTGRPRAGELRTGVGIVYGRRAGDERAVLSYGLRILPFAFDPAPAVLEWGVKVEGECEKACVSVPAGQWITFDRDGDVGMYFDEKTGFLHFGVRGRPPAFSIQMSTPEKR